jgi:hypothetical protein
VGRYVLLARQSLDETYDLWIGESYIYKRPLFRDVLGIILFVPAPLPEVMDRSLLE